MKRGWRINAMGLCVLILIIGYVLDRYGDRLLDMLQHIVEAIF